MVSYTFATFDIPETAISGAVNGINDFGQITGDYDTGNASGFVQTAGHFQSFRPPNSTVVPGSIEGDIFPYGINNLDQVAGLYIDANTRPQIFIGQFDPFTDQLTNFQTVADPYPGTPLPAGLNDFGNIVGQNEYLTPNGTSASVGWVDKGGTFSPIEAPQASIYTSPEAINDFGQITGWFGDASGLPHGFVDTNGTFTTVDVPGALTTQPTAINNVGVVVGNSYTPGNGHISDGFIDIRGQISTVDVPGATRTFLTGLNDLGQIAGSYTDPTGTHQFVATPVPALDHHVDLANLGLTHLRLAKSPSFLKSPLG